MVYIRFLGGVAVVVAVVVYIFILFLRRRLVWGDDVMIPYFVGIGRCV